MLIYNVTTNIDDSIHEEWKVWMQQVHIPAVLATGKFTEARMTKVLIEEEMGGQTYSVQYTTESRAMLQKYYAEDAEKLRQQVTARYADKLISFRTELELISDH